MPEILSGPDFAMSAAQALIQSGVEQEALSLDPDRFTLFIKDGRGVPVKTIRLQNFFERYTADSRRKNRILEQIVELSRDVEMPSTFEEAIPHLRPVVRGKWWFRDDACPSIDVGEHLCVLLAQDLPDQIAYVTADILAEWGTTFDEAFDHAFNELAEATKFEFETYQSDDDLNDAAHFFSATDSYGASRLVYTEMMSSLPVLGETIIAIPNKDYVLVTGSDCRYGLSETLSAIKELQHLPGALAPTLMKLDKGYYYPYVLPIEHELYAEYRQLELEFTERLYFSQKQELDAQYAGLVGEKTILNYKVNVQSTAPYSICYVGVELLPASLPKTDFVIFGKESDPMAVCSWARMEEILGDRLICVESYPPRYEIYEFPNVEELESLGFELGSGRT